MRVQTIAGDRTLTLEEARSGGLFLIAGELTLPTFGIADDCVIFVKATAAASIVSAKGIEVGDGSTSGDPATLDTTTSAISLAAGDSRILAWSGSIWLQVGNLVIPAP